MRTRFESPLDHDTVAAALAPVVESLGADHRLRPESIRPGMLVMVSKYDHCLLDLLYRQSTGELAVEIPLVVSNHTDTAHHAARYGVRFEHLPVTTEIKEQQERRLLQLTDEHRIDFVVPARHMQISSADLCEALRGRAINIHHSFLPGFEGARPYHQAHARGVKLIGATAHHVTSDLDEGPIIEQDVERVTHAHTAEQLTTLGQDIERRVLAQAVRYHAEDRVILIGSKTVVFG